MKREVEKHSMKGCHPVKIIEAMRVQIVFYFLLCIFFGFESSAQDIPMGTWRTHVSYSRIVDLTTSANAVYAAAPNGILRYDVQDRVIETITRADGLSAADIVTIAFDQLNDQLLVGYGNGTFDAIRNGRVSTFNPTEITVITGSKKIHSISIRLGYAYLATDYGVVVFDVNKNQVKETWRDLSETGNPLAIHQVSFLGDSIYLATAKGILAAHQHDNLLDFQRWNRYQSDDFSGNITKLVSNGNMLFAAINGKGLYTYNFSTGWLKADVFVAENFSDLSTTTNGVLVVTNSTAIMWEPTLGIISENHSLLNLRVARFAHQTLWLGDYFEGLHYVTANNDLLAIHPQGPSHVEMAKSVYINAEILGLGEAFTSSMEPLNQLGKIDVFSQLGWSTKRLPLHDITDVKRDAKGILWVSSYTDGLFQLKENNSVVEVDALAQGFTSTKVTSMAVTTDGLWVSTFGDFQSLHLLKTNGTWEHVDAAFGVGQYPLKIIADYNQQLWMMIHPTFGGGLYVYNHQTKATHYLSEGTSSGNLPSRNVRSIAVDREGYVWVGTDMGVCYFYSPTNNAVKPIYESRFLLRDDKVTAIAVDGGNRKWIGTERGVWLFDPSGERMIHHFTTSNSPILSNIIRDISINGQTGEVFFITDHSVSSYRSDATDSKRTFSRVKIFPNPVSNRFAGNVSIQGLATDATVKIIDLRGRLVYETEANGGTATWNVHDYTGKRATTGIYIAIAIDAEGTESEVGKIAVVD
jgi:ligand-binding sensor domain-containing protein